MRITGHLRRVAPFLRFAIVGSLATVVYAALAWAGIVWLGAPAAPASLASYAVAAFVSYFGHRWVTFRSTRPHGHAVPRFLGVTAGGYGVSLVVPFFLTDLLGLNVAISIAATCIAIPLLNYFGQSRLVFSVS